MNEFETGFNFYRKNYITYLYAGQQPATCRLMGIDAPSIRSRNTLPGNTNESRIRSSLLPPPTFGSIDFS